MRGDTPLTSRLNTPVLVDGATGALTTVARMPWYLTALGCRVRCISATTAACR